MTLLDLDLDVCGLILNKLGLLELFFLSRTCRAMRVLAQRHRPAAVARASLKQRLEVWAEIVWMKPRAQLREHLFVAFPKDEALQDSFLASWIETCNHVLFLPYNRYIHGVHAQPVAFSQIPAFEPEFIEVLTRPRCWEYSVGSLTCRETITPDIEGYSFAFKTEFNYWKPDKSRDMRVLKADFREWFPDVCKHLPGPCEHTSVRRVAEEPRVGFAKDLTKVLEKRNQDEIRGCCKHCFATYSFLVRQGCLKVCILQLAPFWIKEADSGSPRQLMPYGKENRGRWAFIRDFMAKIRFYLS